MSKLSLHGDRLRAAHKMFGSKTPSRTVTLSRFLERRLSIKPLLLVALSLHVMVATAVFLIGKYQFLPNQIDPVGLAKDSDAASYQGDCIILGYVLRDRGIREWLVWPTQLHVRLYSLPVMIVFRTAGFSILALEPLNALYYLAILYLVFKIGLLVFDRESALLTAGLVALWPSFVFHTTQMFRDPLLILATLVVTYVVIAALSAPVGWRSALLFAIASMLGMVIIWIVRSAMWYPLSAALAVGFVLLILQSIRAHRLRLLGALLTGVCTVTVVLMPRLHSIFNNQQEITVEANPGPTETWQRVSLIEQINSRRKGFQYSVNDDGNVVSNSGVSNIDTDIKFHSVSDLIRYSPRALTIGMFSPFPNIWFAVGGRMGRAGRLLAAVETFCIYLIEFLALFGLWRTRRKVTAWFLLMFALIGVCSLAIVTSNLGALYRLRYPFFLMIFVIGAGGAVTFVRCLRSRLAS